MTKDKKAFSASVIIWVLFFAAAFFIPAPADKKKQSFGTLSIKLEAVPADSVPVQSSAVNKSKDVQRRNENTQSETEKQVVSAHKTGRSVTAAAKTLPVQNAERESQHRNVPLQKSMEELMAERAAVGKNERKAVWDESVFSDSETKHSRNEVQKETFPVQTVNNTGLAGSAASAANREKQKTAISSGTGKKAESVSASGETETLLAKIGEDRAEYTDGKPGSTAFPSVQTGIDSAADTELFPGGITVRTSDGKIRKLIEPAKPVLIISKEHEKLIDSSRRITVVFTVLPDGNVLPSSISFSPSALLPVQIQTELSAQLLHWRFEPGSGNGQASFIYSINKR